MPNAYVLRAARADVAADVDDTAVVGYGGTAGRTIAAKLGDALYAEDFGAVGDGTTDDSTALLALIAACEATGATGRLRGRVYAYSQTLVVSKAITLKGEGVGEPANAGLYQTVLKKTADVIGIQILSGYAKVLDLAVYGVSGTVTKSGIEVGRAANDNLALGHRVVIRNVCVRGHYDGVWVKNGNKGVMDNVTAAANLNDGIRLDSARPDAGINCNAWLLTGCDTSNNGRGLNIDKSVANIVKGWTAENNTGNASYINQPYNKVEGYAEANGGKGYELGGSAYECEIDIRELSNGAASTCALPYNNRITVRDGSGVAYAVMPSGAVLFRSLSEWETDAGVITTNQWMSTEGKAQVRLRPTAAVTGFQLGWTPAPGQQLTLVNESLFTITFHATDSLVSGGSNVVIQPRSVLKLVWNATLANWFPVSPLPAFGTVVTKDVGNAVGNVPMIESGGTLNASVIPSIPATHVYVDANQAAMLAHGSAVVGDISKRTDLGTSFVLSGLPSSTLGNWISITDASSVTSVNGLSGAVVLSTTNISEGTNLYYTNARVLAVAAPIAHDHNALYYLKSETDTAIATNAPNVTLGATATPILGLSGQDLSFDSQTANLIFAGPTSGGAAAPTFRAPVLADLPSAAFGTGSAIAGNFLQGDRTWSALPAASATASGIVELATLAEADAQTDTVRAVTPAGLVNRVPTTRTISTTAPLTGGGDMSANRTLAVSAATTAAVGVVELATTAEATAQTDATRAVTPAGLADRAFTSHQHAANDITSGVIDTPRLGSGSANATTYLRGDQTWATVAGGGGFTPAWFSKIYGAHGQCDPDEMRELVQSFSTAATPTQITVSVARVSFFRPPADITVNKIRFYGVGATTGVYQVAIYDGTTRARLTAQLSVTTAANAFGSVGSALNLTLTAGTLYFIAVSVNTTGTTAGLACFNETVAATTGAIQVVPTAWPGNMDLDAGFMGGGLAQFAVTTGALPTTAPAIAAQGAWAGGMCAFWLDASNL